MAKLAELDVTNNERPDASKKDFRTPCNILAAL